MGYCFFLQAGREFSTLEKSGLLIAALNQPKMWLILAIDSIRGGYLFLVLSSAVDLHLNQLAINQFEIKCC
jgi:hypothetical protein